METEADCPNCPFSTEGKPTSPVPGEGPADPKFIILGEGPGKEETRIGRPFVGQSGQLVNRILGQVKVARSEVYVGNCTLCAPTPGATEKQRLRAARACLPRLKAELSPMAGKPLLLFGAVANRTLIPSKLKPGQLNGTLSMVDVDGTGTRAVVPTFHPAFLLRGKGTNDSLYYNLVYDVGKIDHLADGKISLYADDIQIEIKSPQSASRLISDLVAEAHRDGWIALDTETSGIVRTIKDSSGEYQIHAHDPREARYAHLTAVGLATANRGISVPWPLVTARTRKLLREVLEDQTVGLVLHNELYDLPVLHWHGFDVQGPRFDTLIAHHAAFPGMAHGLQNVASQFFLVTPWKSEYRDSGDTLEDHCVYNAKDTLATARLRGPLIRALKSRGEKVFELDMRQAEIAYRMHERGIPISRSVNAELAQDLYPRTVGKREKLLEFFSDKTNVERYIEHATAEQAKMQRKGDPSDLKARVQLRVEELRLRLEKKGVSWWNPSVGVHVAPYLQALGVPLFKRTDKGRLSTRAEVMEDFGNLSAVRDILDYRGVEKCYSTFVAAIPKFLDEDDFIHPNWKVTKNTGRWSADKPMVQNWPEGTIDIITGIRELPNVRAQVVAPDGWVLVGADMDKLEVRIIAWFSGDEYLYSSFAEDRDIHSEIAADALPGFSSLEVKSPAWKLSRNLAKNCEYSFFYKGSPKTTLATVRSDKNFGHVTIDHINRLYRILFKRFHRVVAWQNQVLRQVATKRELVNPINGRRWMFPMGMTDPNLAVNWGVQSTGIAIMAEALDDIDRRLEQEVGRHNAAPIIHLHDAPYILCKEDCGDRVAKIVEESMAREYTLGPDGICRSGKGRTMNFFAKAKIAKTWAEL